MQFRIEDGKPQWKPESAGADAWAFFKSGGTILTNATVSGNGNTSTFTVSSTEPIDGFFIISTTQYMGSTIVHTLYYNREFGEDVYYDYDKSDGHKVISSTKTSFTVQNINTGWWWGADRVYGLK